LFQLQRVVFSAIGMQRFDLQRSRKSGPLFKPLAWNWRAERFSKPRF
jgi:hypothetical protein